MTSVARTFATNEQAAAAADALVQDGFPADSIFVVPAPSGDGTDGGSMRDALLAGSLLGDSGGAYLDSYAAGNSLVVVGAEFGMSGRATQILERSDPVSIAAAAPAADDESRRYATGREAPLSAAFGWPLLARDNLPFSDFWGLEPLSSGLSWMSRLFPPLAKPNAGISKMLGLKVLSGGTSFLGPKRLKNKPAPLSSMFGMKTVSAPKKNWNSSLGFPLLSRKATPLSSMFGMRTLTRS